MSLRGRVERIRESVADSKTLEKGQNKARKALGLAADGCGFAAHLAGKLVRPLTRRVRDEYKAYKRSVKMEESR